MSPEYGKYLEREKIIHEITRQAAQEMFERSKDDKAQLLARALVTAPIYFDFYLYENNMSRDDFRREIIAPAIESGRDYKIAAILQELCTACGRGNRLTSEVAIDVADQRVPKQYDILFDNDKEILERIAKESSELASIGIIKIVEGEVPLLRYRKDLIRGITTLKAGYFGVDIGTLPTKVPGMSLRLLYPRNQQIPNMSFVVSTL